MARMQEWVALAIVFGTAAYMVEAPFRGIVLKGLSELLLKRGRVKWAMRVRRWSDPRWAKSGGSARRREESHCG